MINVATRIPTMLVIQLHLAKLYFMKRVSAVSRRVFLAIVPLEAQTRGRCYATFMSGATLQSVCKLRDLNRGTIDTLEQIYR